jgi:hypothetical protein
VIQADNTTSQCKNSAASVFLALLVAKGKFTTCTMNFLTVGHTHEDIDRFFSYLLFKVLRPCLWETPADLIHHLKTRVADFVAKKGEQLFVQEIFGIHDFDTWVSPLGISFKNCFVSRDGKLAAHSFIYKMRADLTTAEVGKLVAIRGQKKLVEHPEDVFCITKGRMYMTQAHRPVLALPHVFLDKLHTDAPPSAKTRPAMNPERQGELAKLATVLDTMPRPYVAAARLIRKMLDDPAPVLSPLSWLVAPCPQRQKVIPTTNKYYEHLPDTSWRLLATFHRR